MIDTVDGSEIRRSPPGMYKTLLNNGPGDLPYQLVSRIFSINSSEVVIIRIPGHLP